MRLRECVTATLALLCIVAPVVPTQASAPPDVISWWPGEGNADDVADGNPGTIVGNVSFVSGVDGQAFKFDGTKNTGVIIGDKPNLEGMSAVSVEAWVCTTDPKGDRAILSKHWSSEGNDPSWILRTYWNSNDGTIGFNVGTNGNMWNAEELRSSTPISDGWFHHVVGTYDGTNVRLYVDGNLEGSRAESGWINNSTNEVVIGNFGSGNHPTKAPENFPSFNGAVDEARVFGRALSQEEITSIVAATEPRACISIPVAVDVKPGSCPNPINKNARGVVPVAVLGSPDFDATRIDPVTVRLEGVFPLRSDVEDVATLLEPFTGKEDCELDCTDQGPDGWMDLTLKFSTQELGEALSDVEDGDCVLVSLTGNLREEFGGAPIVGEDVVICLDKGR